MAAAPTTSANIDEVTPVATQLSNVKDEMASTADTLFKSVQRLLDGHLVGSAGDALGEAFHVVQKKCVTLTDHLETMYNNMNTNMGSFSDRVSTHTAQINDALHSVPGFH